MKRLFEYVNQKCYKMLKYLSRLSKKQIFIVAAIITVPCFIYQTYRDLSHLSQNDNISTNQEMQYLDDILTKQEIAYLLKWYELDYEKDLAEADKLLTLSRLEIMKRYDSNNPDPTIPLIYKIPKYLIKKPNAELQYIFMEYLQVHMRYAFLQITFDENGDATLNPKEIELFNDIFESYQVARQIDSPEAIKRAIDFSYVATYMTIMNDSVNYCKEFGDFVPKIKMAYQDIYVMLEMPLYKKFYGEDYVKATKIAIDKVSKNANELRICE